MKIKAKISAISSDDYRLTIKADGIAQQPGKRWDGDKQAYVDDLQTIMCWFSLDVPDTEETSKAFLIHAEITVDVSV